jgi:hypothetical protein
MKKVSGGRTSVYFSYRPKFKADTHYKDEKTVFWQDSTCCQQEKSKTDYAKYLMKSVEHWLINRRGT